MNMRRVAAAEPDTMVSVCESLLQEPMLEEAIRAGECVSVCVSFYGNNQ